MSFHFLSNIVISISTTQQKTATFGGGQQAAIEIDLDRRACAPKVILPIGTLHWHLPHGPHSPPARRLVAAETVRHCNSDIIVILGHLARSACRACDRVRLCRLWPFRTMAPGSVARCDSAHYSALCRLIIYTRH